MSSMLYRRLRTSWVGVIALLGILYTFDADAQTVSPTYSSQFRVDKLLTLNDAPTQMAWGPDGRLYIRLLHNGVASYAYNKTTGTLSDVKQAVTGFPGIGLAFHQNHMYLTTMDESIVKLDDQNGNGIWGEPGELSVRIATHIPTGDHNVDQLLVQGNSLYVGIGTRTTNGYSGDFTAGSFDDYGGQGFYNPGGVGKSWGDSAYNGTISWIQDLTAVANIEGSANAYPNSTLTQTLVQQDDSPFVVSAPNKLIVHSAGTRNPYGMCFDRLGDLWFTNNFNRNKTNGDGTVGFGNLKDELSSDFSMDIHDQLFRASRGADYGFPNVNWRPRFAGLGYHPVRSTTFDNLFNPGPYVLTDPANPDGLGPSSSSNGCSFFYANGLPPELAGNVFVGRFNAPITEAPPGTDTVDYRDIVAVDTATGKIRQIASGFAHPLSVFWDGAQRLLIGNYGDNALFALVAINNPAKPLKGDLDGDGKGDLVFRNLQTGDVAGWLMNGPSIKQAGVIYPALSSLWQIAAIGDLNGDGKADLVFRNTQTGDIAGWLMNGLTISQAGVIYPGLPLVWEIAGIADLDGDGKADLVFRNSQTGDVAGWLMNGLTLKQGGVIYSALSSLWQISGFGDLDGDGKADLVFRNTQTGDVAAWLMNGLALKQGGMAYPGLSLIWLISAIGDLNADGKADIVFRNTQTGDVSAWLMNGLTLTQAAVVLPGVPQVWQIDGIGDLDADGKRDLLWRNTQTGDVSTWLVNGLAIKQAAVVYPGLPAIWQIQ